MKTLLLLTSLALSIISCQAGPAVECQWGPSYWCQSKQTAIQCGQEAYCKTQVWKVQPAAKVQRVQSVQCDVCKLVVQLVDKEVENNKTEAEAQQALDDLCSKLGSLGDECKTLVDSYFPQIWQLLVNETDPNTVCSVIGLCKSAKLQVATKVPVKVKSVQCDVCKLVVQLVDKEVVNNKTEAEAQQALDDLCSKLGSLGDECKTLVDSYFPQIWQLLVNEADPDTVCSAIGLCTSSKLQVATKMPVKVKSVQCDVCKLIVQLVDKEVVNNKTEAEAQQALDDLCSKLGSLGDECKTLVDSYFPQIWQLLMNEADPDTVCSAIGLCTSSKLQVATKVPVKVKSVQCDVCKLVVQLVDKEVVNNKTEAEAQQALDDLCSKLGSLGDECKTLVDSYFPQIWQMLINEADPDTVCSAIGLCKSSKLQVATKVPVKLKSVQCDVCKIVVQLVDKYVENNTTEAEAQSAIEKICDELGSLKDECNTLVDTFFPQIWQMLVKETDPDTVCTEIKLCTSAKVQMVPAKLKSVQCDVCKIVVQFVDQYVESNKTEAEAQSAVEKICGDLGSLKDECNTLVDTFFPEIWQLLVKETDPDTVCTEIKLCTSAQVQMVPTMVKSVQCDVCKLVVGYLDKFVQNNATEAEAQAAIEKICGDLGSLKDECNSLVDDFFPDIWKMLMNQLDPDTICSEIKLCTSEVVAKVQSEAGGVIECDVCKEVAKLMQKYADENKTEGDVQRDLEGLCKVLGSFRSKCDTLLESYFPQIWKMIVSDLDPATICSELKLCTSQVAKVQQQAVSQVKSMECDYCKIIAMYLNKFVASNGTETEAKDEVKKLCSLLGSAASECNSVVDLFFDQIWKMVVDETKPDVICQLLKLCTNASALKPPLSGNVTCDICHLVFVFIRPIVDDNETQNDIRQFFEDSFCDNFFMPAAQNKCVDFFETYFGYIWGKIRDEMDADLTCNDIGVCNSTKLPSQPMRSSQNYCNICEMLTKEMRTDFASNESESEIKTALKSVCDNLAAAHRNECYSFLDQYFEDMWKVLLGELENGLLCKQLGVCSSTMATVPSQPMRSNQNFCSICEMFINEIQTNLNNETQLKVILALYCYGMPDASKDECYSFVEQYCDQIWKILQGEFGLLCKKIGVCNSTMATPIRRKIRLPQQNLCDLCKLVVNYVKPLVENNATETEVKQALESLCNLPIGNKSTCMKFVDDNFEKIWELLESEFDNDYICKQIGVCNSTMSVAMAKQPIRRKTAPSEGNPCELCDLIVNYVKFFVESNATKPQVADALLFLCKVLNPEPYRNECAQVLQDDFDEVWEELKKDVDNDYICKKYYCRNSTVATVSRPATNPIPLALPLQPIRRQSAPPKNSLCQLCDLVVNYFKIFVENNATRPQVEEVLVFLCKVIDPPPYRKQCAQAFHGDMDAIWQELNNDFYNDNICKQENFCNDGTVAMPSRLKTALPKDNLCDICKMVAGIIQPFVDSNFTKYEVEQTMNAMCGTLPDTIKNKCMKYVADNFTEMWKLTEEEFDNSFICKQIGFCTSTVSVSVGSKLPVSKPKRLSLPKQTACDLCKLVVQFLAPYVESNSTEDEVEKALEGLCNILPSGLKTECTNLLDKNFGTIWLLLKSEFDNDLICKQIGLCNSTVSMVKLPVSKPKRLSLPKQNLCDLCKLAVTFLKQYVDKNATESEAKQAVEQLCNILPSGFKNECTSLIDANFDTIWSMLMKEFDNDLICKQIGLCTNSSVVALPKLPTLKRSLIQQSACDVCKLVVTFIKPYVENNSTEKEVEETLDEVCNLLPGNYSKQCDSLLDNFFPSIWEMLKGEFDDSLICKQLGLCSSSSRTKSLSTKTLSVAANPVCDVCKILSKFIEPFIYNKTAENQTVAVVERVCNDISQNEQRQECKNWTDVNVRQSWDDLHKQLNSGAICADPGVCPSKQLSLSTKRLSAAAGPACEVCKILSTFLRPFADNKTTEKEAVEAVEKLCTYLPTDYSQTCKNMTDKYVRQAWDDFQHQLDDGTICDDICPSKQLEMSGPVCVLCEFVMKELESMLDTNTTEAEIKAALDKVCSILPSSIKDDCDGFVNTYGDDIIKLLLEAVSPKVVCSVLHLCLGAETSTVVVMPVVEESVEMDDCLLCKTVLGFVKTLVKDYQKPIEGALDDVCDLMPSTIKSECTAFVNEFGPAIIQLVDQDIDPEQLCKDLKLCKSESSLMAPWKKLARAKSF